MKRYFFELYPIWNFTPKSLPEGWYFAESAEYGSLMECELAAVQKAQEFFKEKFVEFDGAMGDVSIELFSVYRTKVVKNEKNLTLKTCGI